MSFLGLRTIPPGAGGLDNWSFDHAAHHLTVTESLNRTILFTGNTFLGFRLITGLSSMQGLFLNMAIAGAGIPAGSVITGLDAVAANMTISSLATATAANVPMAAAFSPIPFFVLDPINPDNRRQFLLDHQQSHNFINAALGAVGNDLQDLNFDDQEEVAAWLDLNFTEHQTWNQATGVE